MKLTFASFRHRALLSIFAAASALGLATGCSDDNTQAVVQAALLDSSSAIIQYRYLDASIPPPGHRSYTLLINPDTSLLTFDSYGDLLGEQMLTTDRTRMDEVLTRLAASDLPEVTEGDCVGGPSVFLNVFDLNENLARSIKVVPCSGASEEAAELSQIIEPVLSLFDLSSS